MGISVRRGCIQPGFLRQDGLYRPVELVFVHNYAGLQFLLFQTHVVQSDGAGRELVTVRSALCAALSATPPRMESSAAWDRGDTTGSEPLPRTISLMTDATVQQINPQQRAAHTQEASGADGASPAPQSWLIFHLI